MDMDHAMDGAERAVAASPQPGDAQRVQSLEAVINEGLRTALMKETPDASLEVLLEYLGRALHGARTYIFERNETGGDDNTYEWVAEGVASERESLQNVPPEVCAGWYAKFEAGQHIVIQRLEDIRESDPLQYETLYRQNIHSLVVVPLSDGQRIIGFYGVDNPPAKSLEYASNMLETAAYFIVSSIKQRNLFRELQKRSYKVLQALSVDYVGIYQVNFDTGACEVYRQSRQIRWDWAAQFAAGYETAMARYIDRFVVAQDQARLQAVTRREAVLRRLQTHRKFSIRYQVRRGDWGLRHMEMHFSAVDEPGAEHCAIFALRDVNTVVEQEEQHKLEARQSLGDILEGARTGIWTIELEEGCEPRMYADRTMRSLLGLSEEVAPEACYRQWFSHIDADYVEMVKSAVQEILSAGRSEVTYPWHHPTLGKIYVRCGGVLDKSFQKTGACMNGYHQDITEVTVARKKQEQAIMELLEKVRWANAAKSEFLSHMSHDLRTPINGILGMLSILEKSQDDPARQASCRKKIRTSTEYLLSLVNDVLQVSKLDSGRLSEVKEPFDLREVLESCLTILSTQAEERKLRMELQAEGLAHTRLLGTPLHLKQILMNVIDNALKFNRPGGFVSVRVQELGCRDGMAEYEFVVEDSGVGIAEDFKDHIFEIFSQADQGARTHYNGVGLGMSIVKKLVDQMDGIVEVDSQVGQGSIVRICLPFRIDGAPARPAGDDMTLQRQVAGMRVLLVEDNEINCEIVEYMLRDAGVEVATANNGKEAVEAFAASAPGDFDCILMDLMMPVMSGFEAARVIRRLPRPDAQRVPIIALSANAFVEDVAMAKDAGMDAHVAKPVDFRKMLQAMGRLRQKKEEEDHV